jgi:acyl dehydratase
MTLDPDCVGATVGPQQVDWTERDTLLYALGVGAGAPELAFTTENSHGVTQQVLPTYAVVVVPALGALRKVGRIDWGTLLHGSQEVRIHRPLPPAGSLAVESEVTDLRDKGPGGHAIVEMTGRGRDLETGELVAESIATVVLRNQGGFGGTSGSRAIPSRMPEHAPDLIVTQETDARLPLIYRLSGDRNPLHSDPWFAREKAGFPGPILHGLCTYGIAGRALVAGLADGDASRLTAIAARFTAPVFPGECLTTEVWLERNGAVFRVQAAAEDAGGDTRIVLDGGRASLRAATN